MILDTVSIINKSEMTSKLLLLFVLCSLAFSDVVIKSDLVGETLADGDPVTQNTHGYAPGFPVPGAIWIWGPNWNSVPHGETRVFT